MLKVTVIIPNYNYAPYLARRIQSILAQSHPPAEIIFLDDASSDNSLVVAEEILKKQPIAYQIIANTDNQGVFKQWLKGVECAKHDIIWIAEADDFSEPHFLARLLPAFADENVVLAYCQSILLNEKLKKIGFDSQYKPEEYFSDPKIWQKDFCHNGYEDRGENMLVMNPIVNVSACLFRRKNILENPKIRQIEHFKIMGDWLLYVLLLRENKNNSLFYCAEALNYFVRHAKSVVQQTKKERYNQELLEIYAYFLLHFSPDFDRQKKMLSVLLSAENIPQAGLKTLLPQFDKQAMMEGLYQEINFQKSLSTHERRLIQQLRKIRKNLGVEQFLKKIFGYFNI
jgi:glycosyltransferase involved in cell wall biosynthesis